MSTTIKLLSLADFEFVSLCLQPKSSFLWQIANLCQHVYNKKKSFSGRFSVCVYVSACLQGNVSLLWQIMSLYLHVYNQQVPSSGRFWVCVYVSACLQPKSSLLWHIFSFLNLLTIEDFVSLVDIEFVSTCLQPKSFHLWQIFSFFSTWLQVYNHKAPFSLRISVFVYLSTVENLPSLADFGFATMCLLTISCRIRQPLHVFHTNCPTRNGHDLG